MKNCNDFRRGFICGTALLGAFILSIKTAYNHGLSKGIEKKYGKDEKNEKC